MESGKDGIATLLAVAKEMESKTLLKFVNLADVLLSVILKNKLRTQRAQSMMARTRRQSMASITHSEAEGSIQIL